MHDQLADLSHMNPTTTSMHLEKNGVIIDIKLTESEYSLRKLVEANLKQVWRDAGDDLHTKYEPVKVVWFYMNKTGFAPVFSLTCKRRLSTSELKALKAVTNIDMANSLNNLSDQQLFMLHERTMMCLYSR